MKSGANDALCQGRASKMCKISDARAEWDDAPGERIGSLNVQLMAVLDKPLAIPPLVRAVWQIGVEHWLSVGDEDCAARVCGMSQL